MLWLHWTEHGAVVRAWDLSAGRVCRQKHRRWRGAPLRSAATRLIMRVTVRISSHRWEQRDDIWQRRSCQSRQGCSWFIVSSCRAEGFSKAGKRGGKKLQKLIKLKNKRGNEKNKDLNHAEVLCSNKRLFFCCVCGSKHTHTQPTDHSVTVASATFLLGTFEWSLNMKRLTTKLCHPVWHFWGLFKQVKMKGIEEKGANVKS